MIYVLQPESAARFMRALDLLEHDHEFLDCWNAQANAYQLPDHENCLLMVEPNFMVKFVQQHGVQPVLDYANHNWIIIGNDIMNSSCWRSQGKPAPAFSGLMPLFDHPRIWRLCDDAHAEPKEIEILSSWWYALDIGGLVAPGLQSSATRTNKFFAMVNGYRPYRQNLLELADAQGLLEHNHVIYHGHQGSADMASRLQQQQPFADLRARRLSRDHHIYYEEAAVSENYAKFACELVLEALVEESLVSEKLVRPILARMPFVCLAGTGTLAYLRKLGFKTFHGLIDESYDQEPDLTKRSQLIVAVLAQLDQEPQGFLNFYTASEHIRQHNFDHLFWLKGRQDLDYAISLQKFLDQCKIPTTTTIHPSWQLTKREYYTKMSQQSAGPWFDHPSGKDHYLTHKD